MKDYTEDIINKLSGKSGTIRAIVYTRADASITDSANNPLDEINSYINDHPNIKPIATFIDKGTSSFDEGNRREAIAFVLALLLKKIDLLIIPSLAHLTDNHTGKIKFEHIVMPHKVAILSLKESRFMDYDNVSPEYISSLGDVLYVSSHSIYEQVLLRKESSYKDRTFGYYWIRKELSYKINPVEADIVQYIYDAYLGHNLTPAAISSALSTKGVTISANKIRNILKDQMYTGRFCINKWAYHPGSSQGHLHRTRRPEEQWQHCEHTDLRIISPELFETVQCKLAAHTC